MNGKVHVMDHPLVAHKLTILRDKDTSVKDFREIVSEIGMLITYEATRDLPLTEKEVETPICKTTAPRVRIKSEMPSRACQGYTNCLRYSPARVWERSSKWVVLSSIMCSSSMGHLQSIISQKICLRKRGVAFRWGLR